MPNRAFHSSLNVSLVLFSLILLCIAAAMFSCKLDEPATTSPTAFDDALRDPAIQPMAVATTPQHGAIGRQALPGRGDGAHHPDVIVQFNKLIDLSFAVKNPGPVSVYGFNGTAAVVLVNDAGEPRQIDTSFGPTYDYLLQFAFFDADWPYERLQFTAGRRYTVTLDTTIADINGRRLRQPVRFSFMPEAVFHVTGAFPISGRTIIPTSAGAQGVPVYQLPTITFNSELDLSIFSHLHIDPAPDGNWFVGYDGRSAYFEPFHSLAFDKQYAFGVDASASDAYGHPIFAPASWAFHTSPFAVHGSSPANGAIASPLLEEILINCTGPVDASSALRAFTISPHVDGQLQPYESYIEYYLSERLHTETAYTIAISADLTARDGTRLATQFISRFTTEKFRVFDTWPRNNAAGITPQSGCSISFNTLVKTDSIESKVHVYPGLPVSVSASWLSIDITPRTAFVRQTTYTIVIDKSVQSWDGHPLGREFQFTFTTGG